MTNPYVTLSSRIAYENRWTRVREDRIKRPDGSDGIYGVVERSDFAVIVPWQDGRLTLVEQFRYPIGERMWEFPMGMWEQTPGVDPLQLAAGELREETGLIAAQMVLVGDVFQGPGYCNQRGYIFLATGLTQADTQRELTEQDMICQSFALAEVEAMIRNGSLRDAITLAAFGLLRVKHLL